MVLATPDILVFGVCGFHKIGNRQKACRQTCSLTSLRPAWRTEGIPRGCSRSGVNQSSIGNMIPKSGSCGFQDKQPPNKLSLKTNFYCHWEPDVKSDLRSHRLQMANIALWSKNRRVERKNSTETRKRLPT